MKAQTEATKIKPASTKVARALETLQQELKEGIQSIALRQKHIKVAHRSEFGWATVEEYDKDELASDSDDEKRLFRAERNAERVALKRK